MRNAVSVLICFCPKETKKYIVEKEASQDIALPVKFYEKILVLTRIDYVVQVYIK